MPKIPEGVLTDEQIAKINGGSCTPEDVGGIIDGLKQNYDTLVDFTSYVMERVLGQ
jgi:hypothetical protein